MSKIKIENVNVHEIFDEAFTTLTEKVSSVQLLKQEVGLFFGQPMLFVIKTKGGFQGQIFVQMEESLMEEIVRKINKGKEMQDEEKILFAMEYLNIVCGRALSEINNQIGNRSRLNIPQYVTDKASIERMDGKSETLFYQSEYGSLKIIVIYKID